MDELNVHQFWGISPCVDLLAACSAAAAAGAAGPLCVTASAPEQQQPIALLQLCPCDCRHLLATICSLAACKATATTTAAAAAQQPTAAQQQIQPQQSQQHHHQQQLQLYVYEAEPEVLARHMLLLAVLLDGQLTARERAEAFLELHGNALLRQRTADYLVAKSKWLEASVAQLSVKAAAGGQQQQDGAGDSSSSSLGVLDVFDLSLLRYQERDALLEAFQRYRHKAGYDMVRAWDGRLRKWYGERFDFRTNLIDWDYHMRLAPRGTPFLDPAAGSIVHFYHFRHWRLTGVAHELRGASYTAANTSLLSTAYGRTKEFKDRHLRDVGRSVSAFGYWGDQLNGPFHAFGTVADDPALFRLVNKQFSHTAVDVAEHNVLGFIASLCGSVGAAAPGSADDALAAAGEGHRANAARGPTSLKALEAAADQEQEPQQQPPAAGNTEASATADLQPPNTPPHQASAGAPQLQQQQHHHHHQDDTAAAGELARLAALEAAAAAAAVVRLVGSVRIILVTGDLKRCLTGRQKLAGRFAAATVGHRHVHLLGPEHQLQSVVQPGGLVLVESGQNLVQLNSEQVDAFEARVVELAAAAGFERHPVLRPPAPVAAAAAGDGDKPAAASGAAGSGRVWRLPPGHIALRRLSADVE